MALHRSNLPHEILDILRNGTAIPAHPLALDSERRFDRLKVLSIAQLLSKAIGYTHSDQSVSSLFD